MTHKPAVGIGGFGRDNTSELIDRAVYIASAAPSSSPTSKAPPAPLLQPRRLAAELYGLGGRAMAELVQRGWRGRASGGGDGPPAAKPANTAQPNAPPPDPAAAGARDTNIGGGR